VDFRPIVTKSPQWYRYHQRNRTEQQRSSQHTEQPTSHHRTTITLPTQLISARHHCSSHSRRSIVAPVITAPLQHNVAAVSQHNIVAASQHNIIAPLQHNIVAASQHNIIAPLQHNIVAASQHNIIAPLQHNIVAALQHNNTLAPYQSSQHHRRNVPSHCNTTSSLFALTSSTIASPSQHRRTSQHNIQFYFSTNVHSGSPGENTGQ
jgi:hypothetical protein